jgi:hypothetical protein
VSRKGSLIWKPTRRAPPTVNWSKVALMSFF